MWTILASSLDLNAQDDDGLGWSTLTDAVASERVRPLRARPIGGAHADNVPMADAGLKGDASARTS